MTAAITWAVLATVGGIAAWLFARRDFHWAYEGWQRACDLHRIWRRECLEQRDEARAKATEAEDRLHQIEQARHLSAKHARAAQLAAKRLQVVGKAAEINREMGR
jgi:hypothetical protein